MRRAGRDDRDAGFTMIELTVSLGLLAIVAASLSGVFWGSLRSADVSSNRTDAAAVASREIEAMRAIPYNTVGFYADQTGYRSTFESRSTVNLGTTSPSGASGSPRVQPQRPDPAAATGFAPDPDPANAEPVVQGGVTLSIRRDVTWTSAADPARTYTNAYKRLTVQVSWTDRTGAHTVRQDSILYPGGLGQRSEATTTTTTTTLAPTAPNAADLTSAGELEDPAGRTQIGLTWTAPNGGAAVTSYSIKYSTSSSFPSGNITVVSGLAPTARSYTVTSLTPDTTYWFAVIAYAGSLSSTSNSRSAKTREIPTSACTVGTLGVTGATSLSTTGTRLAANSKMTENLTLTLTTAGPCTSAYSVRAVGPSNLADPGSPYTLTLSAGTLQGSVLALNQKGWAIGTHTFTVWNVTTNTSTGVVKTFKVCARTAATC
ncbi:MAG: fibronectin type III domain-containing protein [Actinomycetota bacterium]